MIMMPDCENGKGWVIPLYQVLLAGTKERRLEWLELQNTDPELPQDLRDSTNESIFTIEIELNGENKTITRDIIVYKDKSDKIHLQILTDSEKPETIDFIRADLSLDQKLLAELYGAIITMTVMELTHVLAWTSFNVARINGKGPNKSANGAKNPSSDEDNEDDDNEDGDQDNETDENEESDDESAESDDEDETENESEEDESDNESDELTNSSSSEKDATIVAPNNT